MSFLFPTAPAPADAFSAFWTQQPAVYLIVAGFCLLLALRLLKRALAPIGALIQAFAAAALAMCTGLAALAMLVVAALLTAR
jgi:hypothetical protein